jgi:acetyl esterase/lipase
VELPGPSARFDDQDLDLAKVHLVIAHIEIAPVECGDRRLAGRHGSGSHAPMNPKEIPCAGSNRFGWTSYLGREPGGADVPAYAAPARAESLTGLPPTWIGVGTFDLFHGEDVAYAKRLEAAGVAVELEIVPGAFHAFDAFRRANVAKAFSARRIAALRRALV